MRFNFLAFIIYIFTISSCENKNDNPLKYEIVKSRAISEIDELKSILENAHPSLHLYVTNQQLDFLFDSIKKTITGDIDIKSLYSKYSYLINQIGCAHTVVETPESVYDTLLNRPFFFPYPVKLVNEKLLINVIGQDLPVGTEILSINNRPIKQVLNSLAPYYTIEGYQRKTQQKNIAEDFALYYFYEYGEQKKISLSIIDTLGVRRNIKLNPVTLNDWTTLHQNSLHYYERNGIDYDFTINDDKKLALMRVFTFGYEGTQKEDAFENFCHNSFRLLKRDRNIENLIIDVRDNTGGSLYFSNLLFSYLSPNTFKEYELAVSKIGSVEKLKNVSNASNELKEINSKLKEDFTDRTKNKEYLLKDSIINQWNPDEYRYTGNVFVITNAKSASAASYFGVMVKNSGVGKVIGEETTGGSFSGNAYKSLKFTLPYSKIIVEFPFAHIVYSYKDQKNKGTGLIPNFIVEDTEKSFKENNDTQIDFILDSLILPNRRK